MHPLMQSIRGHICIPNTYTPHRCLHMESSLVCSKLEKNREETIILRQHNKIVLISLVLDDSVQPWPKTIRFNGFIPVGFSSYDF